MQGGRRRHRKGGGQNGLRGLNEEGCSTLGGKADVRLHDLYAVVVPMGLDPRRVLRMIPRPVVMRRKPCGHEAQEGSGQQGGSTEKRMSAAHAA